MAGADARAGLARELWAIGAVGYDFDRPTAVPHARPTPLYIDTRQVLSRPDVRNRFIAALLAEAAAHGADRADLVAGDETAGIAFAALVARELDRGMVYIRKRPKEYGLGRIVEGGSVDGASILVVTDLVNSGRSLLPGIRDITAARGTVSAVISIIKRSPIEGYQPYAAENIRFHWLIDVFDVLRAGLENGFARAADVDRILKYLDGAREEEVYAAG